MRLGMHIYELLRLRKGVVVSALIATVAAVSSVAHIGLLPPKLTPRSLETATAATHVVVDTPRSTVYDLRQDTYDFQSLSNRTVLLANVMASTPVREYIGRRLGLPGEAIQISTPLTPEEPQALVEPGQEKHTTDILRSTDQYRISLQANPPVPVLDIYAQAPNAAAAEKLANAAVDGLRDYLSQVAGMQGTAARKQIHLRQLGEAHGELINDGVGVQAALLTFLIVFGVCSAAAVFLSRIRAGWLLAARRGQGASA